MALSAPDKKHPVLELHLVVTRPSRPQAHGTFSTTSPHCTAEKTEALGEDVIGLKSQGRWQGQHSHLLGSLPEVLRQHREDKASGAVLKFLPHILLLHTI